MSERPPWAVAVWHDARNLYLELPSLPGQAPAVLTFPLTEGGLGKALKQIRFSTLQPDPRILGFSPTAKTFIPKPKVTRAKGKDQFDEGMRASARDILRRLRAGG